MDKEEIYKRTKEIENTHGYKMGVTKKMDKEEMLSTLCSNHVIFEDIMKAIEEIINDEDEGE